VDLSDDSQESHSEPTFFHFVFVSIDIDGASTCLWTGTVMSQAIFPDFFSVGFDCELRGDANWNDTEALDGEDFAD